MNAILRYRLIIAAALAAASPAVSRSEDATVDQLIKKLPPPETVARSSIALDPALRDPLTKQVVDSAKTMNFGNAYAASQKLAQRYPKSAVAQCLYGRFALFMRRYPEAAAAYRKALNDQPNLPVAYLGLGMSEAARQNFSAAMSDYRQVARLAPKADVGWIAMSACSEKLGHKSESLDYARQATAVAPSSAAAWLQVAREERLSGDQQAASKALARANQLQAHTSKADHR
jgi:tetratricopeptide (TPR) repeat protein